MDFKSRSLGESITTPASGTGIETLTAPMDWLGPPGKYVELHVLAQLENPVKTDEERRNDKSNRPFKVSCNLGKFWRFYGSKLREVSATEGDSFIVGPEDFNNLELSLEKNKYSFSKNQAGEYSYVEFECSAKHYKHAQHIFHHGLAQFLDILSYTGKSPLFIQSMRIEDVENQLVVLPQSSPFRHQSVMLGEIKIHPEMNNIYSMYREGKKCEQCILSISLLL